MMVLRSIGLGSLLAVGGAYSAHAAEMSAPVCQASEGYAASFEGRRVFLWRPDWLRQSRARLAADPDANPAFEALKRDAEQALVRAPYSVVDKTRLPASGDRHDYMSMGPYWWPDPAKADGLPYIRRDGHVNPERGSGAFDVNRLEGMSSDVQTLALAYYFSEDRRYAEKAATLLRAWFLDPATRMNPNLEHGQAIPGRVAGRAEGVIDAHRLPRVIESIGLLHGSGALEADEVAGLQRWFAELGEWMLTSPIGQKERAARNNHGLYYDTLLTHFALFSGDAGLAGEVAGQAKAARLATQISPDGALPEELARTRSMHYVTWTLNAAFDLAELGACVGVDLWNHEAADGSGSLRRAVDFLIPFSAEVGSWPYPELDRDDTLDYYKVMLRAGWRWNDPRYLEAAGSLGKGVSAQSKWRLLIPAAADSHTLARSEPHI